MSGPTLQISGTVQTCECRFETDSRPVLLVFLTSTSGHTIVARQRYPDSSATSAMTARTTAKWIKGHQVSISATNPRFKARRMDCDTGHITITDNPTTTRKDLA